ncbi:MAG TPA: SPOR domain-containing protein [Rhizomicrobium sp.]
MTIAKIVMFGLPVALLPCIASAVVMPTGAILEQVDMTFLGEAVPLPPADETARIAGWVAQVGAFTDRDMADAQLTRIAAMLPSSFADAAREVTPVTGQDGRILYRARFSGFDQAGAQSACATLSGQGQSCFVSADHAGVRQAASTPGLRGSTTAAVAAGVTSPLTRLASMQTVGDDELQDMRGGFFTAAGAHFDFGARVQTMVNGQLVLQSNVTWTPAGAITQQLAGLGTSIRNQVNDDLAKAGMPVASSPGGAAAANTPAKAVSAPTVQTPVSPVAAQAAPAIQPAASSINTPSVASSSPSGPQVPGLSGVEIQSPSGGSTQVLANLGGNSIQNIVLNSASNQNIVQNTNVMLTIYNFPAWQQQIAQNAVSAQLAHDIMSAAGLGGSR